MRDDYEIAGPTKKVEFEVETQVAEIIEAMTSFTKLSSSEIVNTAMKRFINGHKDFLPPEKRTPVF